MNFEDLDVWKRAARLSSDIFKALSSLKDYGFRDQITRSGLSVPSNIAEGSSASLQKNAFSFVLCQGIMRGVENADTISALRSGISPGKLE